MVRILVVDDDPDLLELYQLSLKSFDVLPEPRSARAVDRLKRESFDLVITDLQMPELDGMQLLRKARETEPDLPIVMVTGHATVDTAVAAMKLGAVDVLTKPFLPDSLVAVVQRLLDERRLRDHTRVLRRQVEKPYSFGELVGKSDAMRAVYETVQKIAGSDVDVLINGETGTGKELVARSIHQSGPRAAGPFIPVDSGAIPENLLESELFGHEKGAFTGADTRRLGLMELADGGTFFLDEIGDMPIALQSKLLRALQERSIRRVGGKGENGVNVRVVAATHRDLEAAIREKQFREDLFYRLNVVRIVLPPLRDRREDIPVLVRHFVERFAGEMNRPAPKVPQPLLDRLSAAPWPGNVRQLQNTVKRALAMCRENFLQPSDFALDAVPKEPADGFFAARELHLSSFERDYLVGILKDCSGDVAEACRSSEIPRGTFYRLLKKHGIQPDSYRT